jgi:hypothetical protein
MEKCRTRIPIICLFLPIFSLATSAVRPNLLRQVDILYNLCDVHYNMHVHGHANGGTGRAIGQPHGKYCMSPPRGWSAWCRSWCRGGSCLRRPSSKRWLCMTETVWRRGVIGSGSRVKSRDRAGRDRVWGTCVVGR